MQRQHWIGGGVAAVAMAATGLLLAAARPAAEAEAAGGQRLKIALVAPREPVPEPGTVMAVGQIVDGFDRADLVRAEPPAVLDSWYTAEDFEWPEPPRPEPRRPVEPGPTPVAVVTVTTPQQSPPTVERTRRRPSFGFDQPLPDFAAEREERRIKLEATAAASPSDRTRLDPVARRDPEMFY